MKKMATKLAAPLLQQRRNRQVMTKLADQLGFVYFGAVSRSTHSHPLIHGMTLSNHLRDRHYTVGSLDGYDIGIVQRTDTLTHPGRKSSSHVWTIVQLDLHTRHDMPHIFIGLHGHSEAFYAQLFAKFAHLQRLPLGIDGGYPKEFLDRYAIYGSYTQAHKIERLIDPDVAKQLAAHFGTLTVEIDKDTVYIYSEHRIMSSRLVQTMIQNGIWLAELVDQRADYL